MRRILLYFLVSFFYLSVQAQTHPNSLLVTISSANLSEDRSTISTQDDELVLFILEQTQNQPINIRSVSFLFDSLVRRKEIQISTFADSVHFLLLELDQIIDNNSIAQLTSTIKTNYQKLINSHNNKKLNEIKKLLNDDDIILAQSVSTSTIETQINFVEIGFHVLDKYEYQLSIKNLLPK